MAYSAPHTWGAGDYPTAAYFNQEIRDNVSFLANPPTCRVFRSTTQTLTTGVAAAIAFDSERFDTDTMHSTVSNTERITFTTAGVYVVTGILTYASNATGNRVTYIRINGAASLGYDLRAAVSGDTTNAIVTTTYKFAAADYVELIGIQNSGGNLLTGSTGNYGAEFSAAWVGLG